MATDNFTDTDGTPLETHDAKWKDGPSPYLASNAEIQSNFCQSEGAWTSFGAWYDNGQADDQSSEVIDKSHSSGEKHVAVRMSAASRGYAIALTGGSGGLWSAVTMTKNGAWFASVETGASYSQAADHTLKISCSGSGTVTINCWIDGTPKTTQYDSSIPITTGKPGIWYLAGGTIAHSAFDDWTDGISSGVTKNVSDTGSGTDSLSEITVSLSLSDTGSGTDNFGGLAAGLSLSDSGAGIDTLGALLAALSLSESGLGTDALQILSNISISDTGAGTDIVNIIETIIKIVTDAGYGTDDILPLSINVSVADAGSGADLIGRIAAALSISDTGSGMEIISAFYDGQAKKVIVTFSVKKPGITFTTKKPGISFSMKAPGITFN